MIRDQNGREPADQREASSGHRPAPAATDQHSSRLDGSMLGGLLAAGNAAVGRLLSGRGGSGIRSTRPVAGNAAVTRLVGVARLQRSAAGPAPAEQATRPPDEFVSSVQASGGGE